MGEGERRRRVVAGVSGSPGSLAALRRAADEARRGAEAELLVVLAWEPPGGDLTHGRSIRPLPVDEFRRDAGGGCSPRSTPPSATRGPVCRIRGWSYGVRSAMRWSRPPTGPRTCW